MKKISPIAMLMIISFMLSSMAFSQFNPTAADLGVGMTYTAAELSTINPVTPADSKGMLYDNGPFVTNPGGGAGGADFSFLESPNTTLGFGAQLGSGNRMADDFDVPAGGWVIDSIIVFCYQTGSTTTSTITAVNLQIWDGEPGTAGATVIWGDATTNIMQSTFWSNCYRGSNLTATDRPIMHNTAGTTALSLDEGTYWVDYQFNGTLGSGPWAPPITIPAQLETGNALQYTTTAGAWGPALDNGSGLQQGMPFLIYGTGAVPPTLNPPTNLAATVDGQDVSLTWDAPVSTTEELIYDDGVSTGGYYYPGFTMSSRMSPAGACKVLKLKYYTSYDGTHTQFAPRVFNWLGTTPGTTILYETTADAVNDDWMEVDISAQNILVNEDFMVGFGYLFDSVYMGFNSIDNGRSWDYDNTAGSWAAWNETYFIRAIVEYTDGSVVELVPVNTPPSTTLTQEQMVYHPKGVNITHSVPPVANFGSRALLGYNAYREGTKLNSSVIANLFYDDLDVAPGTYDYTVTAVYDEGESVPAGPVEVTIYGVSVNEPGQQAIQVYPNPTSGFINLKSDDQITGIELVSFSGKKVYSNLNVNNTTARVNVSTYPSGIYLVKVTTAQGVSTVKITVTH